MITVGLPDTWRVKLKNGNSVLVMADMHEQIHNHHIFSILVDATEEEQASPGVHITNRTPSNPARVVVTVAAFLCDDVDYYESGESWKEIASK